MSERFVKCFYLGNHGMAMGQQTQIVKECPATTASYWFRDMFTYVRRSLAYYYVLAQLYLTLGEFPCAVLIVLMICKFVSGLFYKNP